MTTPKQRAAERLARATDARYAMRGDDTLGTLRDREYAALEAYRAAPDTPAEPGLGELERAVVEKAMVNHARYRKAWGDACPFVNEDLVAEWRACEALRAAREPKPVDVVRALEGARADVAELRALGGWATSEKLDEIKAGIDAKLETVAAALKSREASRG